MSLFTDFYNTVAKFFRPQEGSQGEEASKSVATNRLKLVLMQDRTNLTPKVLEQMRGELVDLLSKYLEMDKDSLELNFEQEGDQVALMLSIPVIRAKDEDEIEEALNSSAESEDDNEDEEADDEEDASESKEEQEPEEIESEDKNIDAEKNDEEPKPKRKRRTKKVTSPEGLEENVSESATEESLENTEA